VEQWMQKQSLQLISAKLAEQELRRELAQAKKALQESAAEVARLKLPKVTAKKHFGF